MFFMADRSAGSMKPDQAFATESKECSTGRAAVKE
jgi:hypothetical protein